MFAALIPPWWKLGAASVVVLALAGTHWKAYTVGRNGERLKAVALKLEQTEKLATFNEGQRMLERENSLKVTEAQNERTKQKQAIQAANVVNRAELVGLRNDIYSLDTKASKESTSTCIARAATARSVFNQCAERLTEVARAADGHSADAVMLQNAWPK